MKTQLEKHLSTDEQKSLSHLEAKIERGKSAFIEVGQALAEIRDKKLYRADFKTFDAYSKATWGFDRTYAHRMIEAAGVVETVKENLLPMGNKTPLPANERQARALSEVPKDKQAGVWKRANDEAPKGKDGKPKVTAAVVRRVAREADPDEIPFGAETEPKFPTKVQPAFENSAVLYDESLQLLKQLTAKLNVLLGDASGKDPAKGGEHIAARRQLVLSYVTNLRSELQAHRPHALCPYCKSTTSKCEACKGLGWVAKQTFEQAPKEKRLEALVA